jgi:opacity protein-like surface antigen
MTFSSTLKLQRGWKHAAAGALCLLALGAVLPARAQSSGKSTLPATLERGNASPALWALELGSGVTFSDVRKPQYPGCTLVPVELTLSRTFQTTWLDGFCGGFFRGTPEAILRGYGTWVWHGVESRILGFTFGGRYNFLRNPGQRLVPFLEAAVGAGWADSQPYVVNNNSYGLGQDFNFNFSVAGGFRYDLTERFFARLAVVYSHYSNGGLSEPAHENMPIDALGPMLSFGWRY